MPIYAYTSYKRLRLYTPTPIDAYNCASLRVHTPICLNTSDYTRLRLSNACELTRLRPYTPSTLNASALRAYDYTRL